MENKHRLIMQKAFYERKSMNSIDDLEKMDEYAKKAQEIENKLKSYEN